MPVNFWIRQCTDLLSSLCVCKYIHIHIRGKVQILSLKNKFNRPQTIYLGLLMQGTHIHLCKHQLIILHVKKESVPGPWRWSAKLIIHWERMENSLWFERFILAFAKALENHSHLTIIRSRMTLLLKSGGIPKSSARSQICLPHSRNTVYLNVPESS